MDGWGTNSARLHLPAVAGIPLYLLLLFKQRMTHTPVTSLPAHLHVVILELDASGSQRIHVRRFNDVGVVSIYPSMVAYVVEPVIVGLGRCVCEEERRLQDVLK